MVDKILRRVQHDGVLAYMDDLIISSKTEEEGLRLLEQVWELIGRAGIKLNMAKCKFLQTDLDYVGHGITAGGAHDPALGK